MINNETGFASKGFMITTILLVVVISSFILYMRSDLYLPADMKNMMAMVESDDTSKMISRFTRDLDRQRTANIADLILIAEKGDVPAQIRLARLYLMDKDSARAFKWSKKAAASGDVRANSYLAYYFECGVGTKKNIKEAIRLYTLAAEEGDVLSQHTLSMLETSKKKAEHWGRLVNKAMKDCPGCDLPSGGCM